MARKKDETVAPHGGATTNKSTKTPKTKKPKKRRWYHQVWEAYTMTRSQDPSITWWILGVFFGVLAVALGIGIAVDQRIYLLIIGLPFAALAAMFVLARRAEKSAYARIEGEPGATLAALGTIRRGWTFDQEPVAVDTRSRDLIFRGVGRAGVLLVTEGPMGRARKLAEQERKRTARVVQNIPITVIHVGREAGQVPLPQLTKKVQKLRPVLKKHEVTVVLKRLTALGGAKLPIPKGVDPLRARPDRKGMRGR